MPWPEPPLAHLFFCFCFGFVCVYETVCLNAPFSALRLQTPVPSLSALGPTSLFIYLYFYLFIFITGLVCLSGAVIKRDGFIRFILLSYRPSPREAGAKTWELTWKQGRNTAYRLAPRLRLSCLPFVSLRTTCPQWVGLSHISQQSIKHPLRLEIWLLFLQRTQV